ncbi:hypothetical protein [Gracilimonas amylolytica]|uniref:hypothetical protein n=1 Tax=Gracilimonas amylolytica TaxID=1749045 RepID=UPI000CD7EC10|nr:hypothetical protein [Gracilimonas amylolytica]
MKRIQEKDIEQFVRFPHRLNADEINEIREAIDDSDETREIYEFYCDFYKEYDRVSEKRVYTIQLSTYKTTRIHGPVILAAKSIADDHEKLKTLATLVSEEHKVVVRVLENSTDASIQIHVLNNKSESIGHTVLSLPEYDLDIVTDKHGKVKGIKNLSGVEWKRIKPILRLPVKMKVFNAKDTSDSNFEIEGIEVDVAIGNEYVELNSELFLADISKLLLVTANETELVRTGQEAVRVKLEKPEDLTVYFYR